MEDTTKNTSVGAGWKSLGPSRPWVWLSKTQQFGTKRRLTEDILHSLKLFYPTAISPPSPQPYSAEMAVLKRKLHAPSTPTHPPPTSRAPTRVGSLICKAVWKVSLVQNNLEFTFVCAFSQTFFFFLLHQKMRRLFNPFNPIPQLTGIPFGSISITYLY